MGKEKSMSILYLDNDETIEVDDDLLVTVLMEEILYRKKTGMPSLDVKEKIKELTKSSDNYGLQRFFKGGSGSGNHGHAGRPGQIGGSAPGHGGGGAPEGEGERKPRRGGGGKVDVTVPVRDVAFETGQITQTHHSFDEGGHVNQTYKVDIEGDGSGIAKATDDEQQENVRGFARDVKKYTGTDFQKCSQTEREVLASEVDKVLGVDLVPNTVFKEIPNHGIGSVQEFKKNLKRLDENDAEKGAYNDRWQEIVKGAVFDRMIGSCDRHCKNVYWQGDKLVFIDNGYTFAKKYEDAWNGDFERMQQYVIREVTFPSGKTRNLKDLQEYKDMARQMADKALENKKTIDVLFKKHKLPMAERKSFWERVDELPL